MLCTHYGKMISLHLGPTSPYYCLGPNERIFSYVFFVHYKYRHLHTLREGKSHCQLVVIIEHWLDGLMFHTSSLLFLFLLLVLSVPSPFNLGLTALHPSFVKSWFSSSTAESNHNRIIRCFLFAPELCCFGCSLSPQITLECDKHPWPRLSVTCDKLA